MEPRGTKRAEAAFRGRRGRFEAAFAGASTRVTLESGTGQKEVLLLLLEQTTAGVSRLQVVTNDCFNLP